MTHSIISLGKAFPLDSLQRAAVSPVGSVGASKCLRPFEVATGDPHLCTLAPGKLTGKDWRIPARSLSGFSEGHFDPLILANCQDDTLPTPPIKENLSVFLRTCVHSRRRSLYARTQRKTENVPYRGIKSGSCPPAVWGKVRLHKGLDAHKSPDPPPGRIDDVVGGFQIVPALVGDQGIAEPTGLDGV